MGTEVQQTNDKNGLCPCCSRKVTYRSKWVECEKLFLRYVDDIVRTVRGEPSVLLDAASSLHPNLQFTLEKINSEGNLPFLDLNINVSQGRRVTCSWYQKPTDAVTILNYRSCAPTQYKGSVIQGTVHRDFRSTSSWELCNIRPEDTYRRKIKLSPKTTG